MPTTEPAAEHKTTGKPVAHQPTGIDELDEMLNGGIPVGATVLLAGSSGTGKTILASQWLFNGYTRYGESGIYISMTEPVLKYLRNASTMSFFKEELVNPMQVHLTDLRAVMKGLNLDKQEFSSEDINTVVMLIRNMAVQSGAKRVVLDSVTAMAYRLRDTNLIREFIFQLGTMLGQINVNVLLTSEVAGDGYSVFGVEEFISDGIIKLFYLPGEEERIRQLEVVKMRGTEFNPHPSVYRITGNGFKLYPYRHRKLASGVSDKKLLTGIAGLDKMTFGGYYEGSTTLLSGASGTGKTVTALHFVAQTLKDGKNALYFTIEESREQLFKNAKTLGWDFEAYEKKGQLTVMAAYPEQRYLDEHVIALQEAVDAIKPAAVVVDSLTALGNVFAENVVRGFTARMVTFFKSRLATSLFTHASETLIGSIGITEAHLSSLFDNIITLRFIEVQSALRHGLMVIKMRGSQHDEAMREFIFLPNEGIRIMGDFRGYEGLLRGESRKTGLSIEEKLEALLVSIFGEPGKKMLASEQAKGLTMDSTRDMLTQLADQGIISVRRKQEFLKDIEEAGGA